jgi:hypothetical protein
MQFNIKLLILLSIFSAPLYSAEREDDRVEKVPSLTHQEVEELYKEPFTYPNQFILTTLLRELGGLGDDRNIGFVERYADMRTTLGYFLTHIPVFPTTDEGLTAGLKDTFAKKKKYLFSLLSPKTFERVERAGVVGQKLSKPLIVVTPPTGTLMVSTPSTR